MEDKKSRLIELYKSYTDSNSHHMDLPNIVLDKLEAREQFDVRDVFGCNARFGWIKDTNLVKGNTLVDLAGSAGFFSLRAISEGMVSYSSVFDINSDALVVGKLSAQLLGISEKIRYENQSLEIDRLKQLPKADVVFCLNFLHHAGIEFDESIVEEIGWENYTLEYLEHLREKYKQIVVGLSFKGTFKPKGLNIPFHKFEEYFRIRILKKAGWNCRASANVGVLCTNLHISQNGIGYKIKVFGLDLTWALTKSWRLTKKMAEVASLTVPGKLGRYFIFMAE